MKYRIIELINGSFRVQSKKYLLSSWKNLYCSGSDYPPFTGYEIDDNYRSFLFSETFPTLDLAKKKIDREIREDKQFNDRMKFEERLEKEFKVIHQETVKD